MTMSRTTIAARPVSACSSSAGMTPVRSSITRTANAHVSAVATTPIPTPTNTGRWYPRRAPVMFAVIAASTSTHLSPSRNTRTPMSRTAAGRPRVWRRGIRRAAGGERLPQQRGNNCDARPNKGDSGESLKEMLGIGPEIQSQIPFEFISESFGPSIRFSRRRFRRDDEQPQSNRGNSYREGVQADGEIRAEPARSAALLRSAESPRRRPLPRVYPGCAGNGNPIPERSAQRVLKVADQILKAGTHRPGTFSMRAAIYARVSTIDQEPENQLQEIRRYVAGARLDR